MSLKHARREAGTGARHRSNGGSGLSTLSISSRSFVSTAMLLVVAFVLALVGVGAYQVAGPAQPANAATGQTCSYADPGSGTYANTICWLDLSAFSASEATSADGQSFSYSIPGGYTLSFTLTKGPGRDVHASGLPTFASAYLGNNGHYTGIAGQPAIYTFSGANDNAQDTTLTQTDITMTDSAGRPVTGWSLVGADAESTDPQRNSTAKESLTWNSSNPITSLTATPGGGSGLGNACGGGFTGINTTSVTCTAGTTADAKTGTAIVASTSPTTFQQVMHTTEGSSVQAVAFGVLVSKLTLNKDVAGRVAASDSFNTSITSPEGTNVVTATTGTASTSTTGAQTVLPRGDGNGIYTLSEAASTGTTTLAQYTQGWVCTNAVTTSATALPSGSGTSKTVNPAPGDDITCTVTNTPPPASLSLVKSASPSGPDDFTAGQLVTYSFEVTNTGGVTLDDLTVTDTDFSGTGTLSAITCPVATLAPGDSTSCTATYALTAADIDAGQVTNTAIANGDTPEGSPVPSNPSSAQIPITPNPSLTLVKTATPTVIAAAGDTVAYSFLMTNTGNVTLADVDITETAFSGTGTAPTISCPADAASLAPGDSVTCTASYTATQADVDAGRITNTAIASGTPPTGAPVDSPPSSAEVTATPSPAIAVVKTADRTEITAAGQTISYSFLVTNTGNVTLSDVAVDDSDFSGTGALSAITCPVATLAPGDDTTCTASYTVTQADVDAGGVINTATATGTPPGDTPPPTSPPSTVDVPSTPAPGISVVKTADRTEFTAPGQTITYSFLVTNTGNVTLMDVTVDDSDFSGTGTLSAITCPVTTLAPGASTSCEATYVTTQADVDAGGVINTATATGTPPGDTPPPTSPPSTVEVPSTPAPAITIVKSADPAGPSDFTVGQTITYSFLVTNTGNVTLMDVTVDDSDFSGTGTLSPITCPAGAASLAPGDAITCTASYQLTQADIDAGSVHNVATATGTPSSGEPPVSPPSEVTIPETPDPAITVVKTADVTEITAPGQTITYSFLVTNTGNVTLTNPTVDDSDFTGTGALTPVDCPTGPLVPGASVTCTASYVTTQADVDAGGVTNTATATGTPPGDTPPPTSPPSTVDVPSDPAPGISVVKTADVTEFTAPGQTITYSFVVTNTGNVTLSDVAVDDGDFSGTGTLSAVICPTTTLAPGASVTCTASYVTTQADVDNGGVTNTATATGTPPGDTPPPTSPPSTVDVPSTPVPGISVVKTADPTTVHHAGDTVTYSFAVTNTGNVTLTDITINETTFSGTGALSAITCPAGAASLAPGASVTCTATYVVTQADVDAGSITNTATATGTPPGDTPPVTSPPSSTTVTAPPAPAITVVKTVSPSGQSTYTVGQKLTYSFVATNTGNTTLTDVTVDEGDFTGSGKLSAVTCPAGAESLAPGASVTCTATYTLTQADIDAGKVTNTAIATGTPPGTTTPPVSPPSTVTVPSPPAPALTVTKTANVTTITAAGQTIAYSFKVTNIGNVTITNPKIDDRDFSGTGKLSAITCPASAASLAPGASVTCTATYVTTADDVASGKLSNTAVVTGTTPGGDPTPPSPPSTVTIPVNVPAPVVSVETGGTVIAPAGASGGLWAWLGLLGAGAVGLAGVGVALYRRRRPLAR